MSRDNFHSRQVVLDASLRLQLVRARYCDEWAAGQGTADVHVFGTDVASLRGWIQAQLESCGELIAVTTTRGQTLEAFVPAHRYNRSLVERGVRMTSFFDASGASNQLRHFIIAADDMPYYLACGSMQVKVLDGERVMVEGPLVEDRRSLMLMRGTEALNAARQYLKAVRDTAVRACEFRDRTGDLTARQHVIAQQLEDGLTDDEIADRLGLSVRTVRYEVARLMEAFEVGTRFAAGVRYARMKALLDDGLQEPATDSRPRPTPGDAEPRPDPPPGSGESQRRG
jgi:DNA-binding CsgD family transcriptional regulator